MDPRTRSEHWNTSSLTCCVLGSHSKIRRFAELCGIQVFPFEHVSSLRTLWCSMIACTVGYKLISLVVLRARRSRRLSEPLLWFTGPNLPCSYASGAYHIDRCRLLMPVLTWMVACRHWIPLWRWHLYRIWPCPPRGPAGMAPPLLMHYLLSESSYSCCSPLLLVVWSTSVLMMALKTCLLETTPMESVATALSASCLAVRLILATLLRLSVGCLRLLSRRLAS